MMFYRFKIMDVVFLAAILTVDYFYITTQHYWVDSMELRFVNLFAAMIASLLVYFFAVKPKRPYSLAASLCVILAAAMILISAIVHVAARNDLSIKQLYIFLVLQSCVFLSAGIYSIIRR